MLPRYPGEEGLNSYLYPTKHVSDPVLERAGWRPSSGEPAAQWRPVGPLPRIGRPEMMGSLEPDPLWPVFV